MLYFLLHVTLYFITLYYVTLHIILYFITRCNSLREGTMSLLPLVSIPCLPPVHLGGMHYGILHAQ